MFQEFLSLIYENINADTIYLMGDDNARVGSKRDLIETIDNIPERVFLDTQNNHHGI